MTLSSGSDNRAAGPAGWIPHSAPWVGEAEVGFVEQLLRSGFVGRGRMCERFEEALCELTGRTHAVVVGSGSSALELALSAGGVGPSARVLMPAFTCRAVLNSVVAAGASAVLGDIDPDTLSLGPLPSSRMIDGGVDAVVVPHSLGAIVDVESFRRPDVLLVEDAAVAIGASFEGRPAGSFGDLSIFSFGSTKLLTAGVGGAVLTDEPRLADRVRRLIDYDSETAQCFEDGVEYLPRNVGMCDFNAALGLAQLRRLPAFLARRQRIASIYQEVAADHGGIRPQRTVAGGQHAYARCVLLAGGRAGPIVDALRQLGIDARTSVAHFLYDYLGLPCADFPASEAVRDSLVSLPVHPSLSELEVEFVATSLRHVLSRECW